MIEKKLTEREALILQAIVHAYVTSAEPVGSRAIVKRFSLNISPATVRNVMADLEEAGYLTQLHTSSGRVPTDLGYRYYVNYLMRVQDMTLTERARLEKELTSKLNDAEEVLRQTSHLLALISHHTGIVEAPSDHEALVRRIELMPLGGARVVVLLADNYGRVRTKVATVTQEMTADEVQRLNRFLNDQLTGIALDQTAGVLRAKLAEFIDEQHRLAERALNILEAAPLDKPAQLFLEGVTQLFEQPEFRDVNKAREVFGLLEERDRVLELLRAGVGMNPSGSAGIIIGAEAARHGMEEISVVSAPYRVGDRPVGVLGVLGPRRMPYSKLTGLVEFTAGMLGRLLTRLAN